MKCMQRSKDALIIRVKDKHAEYLADVQGYKYYSKENYKRQQNHIKTLRK